MDKEIFTIRDIEIEKNKFYRHKAPILLRDVDTDKVLVSTRFLLVRKNYKYFIGYYLHNNNNNNNKVKPLHIMLLKTSAYVKDYDGETKWMDFLIEDDVLLERYNNIWEKVSSYIKKEFDNEQVYNKIYLETKNKIA